MLTLGTNLIAELKNKATEACWLLDLFYNDDDTATNVIHLSDKDRTVGGVDYLGIVRSWGSLHHAADLVEFTSSTGTITIILDNTGNAIAGGRFTDLFATKNFANRKWTIHLSDGINVSTDSIGSGRISDDIDADDKTAIIQLLDYDKKFDIEIPASVVDSATYPNAPEKNIGKPFPMSFGDFSQYGTAVTAFEAFLTYGKFPAIITDLKDIDAMTDKAGEAMNALDTYNLFMRITDSWAVCNPNNVTVNAATPIITFGQNSWSLNILIIKDSSTGAAAGDESLANLYDKDESTTKGLYSAANGAERLHKFYLPVVSEQEVYDPGIGATGLSLVWLVLTASSVGGTNPEARIRYKRGDDYAVGDWVVITPWATGYDGDYIGDNFPEMGAYVEIGIRDKNTADQVYLIIKEILVNFAISPLKTFTKEVIVKVNSVAPAGGIGRAGSHARHKDKGFTTKVKRETFLQYSAQYVYFAGKGREYGTWIDTINGTARADYTGRSDPDYNAGALIENPIYIVESVCRTEGSFDEDDLDLYSFDRAGDGTIGIIEEVFNADCVNIKFAFSQYQFTTLKEFWERIGKQCGTLFYISGSGKLKAQVRRRTSNWSAGHENLEIDYNDIKNISFSKTPIVDVKNDITVKYACDYANEEMSKSVNPAADATSYGDGLTGYNQRLYLEEVMDCCLDAVTADNYADVLQTWHKDRHFIIKFETALPRYQALEIGDIIEFFNWSANFKVYGTIPTTADLFMVQDITKSGPGRTMISVMEVS